MKIDKKDIETNIGVKIDIKGTKSTCLVCEEEKIKRIMTWSKCSRSNCGTNIMGKLLIEKIIKDRKDIKKIKFSNKVLDILHNGGKDE